MNFIQNESCVRSIQDITTIRPSCCVEIFVTIYAKFLNFVVVIIIEFFSETYSIFLY